MNFSPDDTLLSLLQRTQHSHQGIRFIQGEHEESFLSYQELFERARKLLGGLQQAGVQRGDEVVIQLEEVPAFVVAFWGCILGGFIPVPLTVGSTDEHRLKVLNVWKVLERPWLISTSKILNSLQDFCVTEKLSEEFWQIKTRTLLYGDLSEERKEGILATPKVDDIAFLQFSSGSTGSPKGVIITHKNVIVNAQDTAEHCRYSSSDIFLSWVPLTHDFGMIGFHLTPLVCGAEQNLFHPQLFVRRPLLWFEKVHQYRASVLGAPNFGYKHFLKSFSSERAKEWDLSCVQCILNGAEPISRDLMQEFVSTLAPYKLAPTAMKPGYGMAESTLIATLTPREQQFSSLLIDRRYLGVGQKISFVGEEEKIHGVPFVEVGVPLRHVEIRICDQKRTSLPDDTVGHIELKGPNVSQGYYNNPDATQETLTTEGWLATGDLGFVHNGVLTITGRAKEVIFVHGVNYYPHDIERAAEGIQGIEGHRLVACGSTNLSKQSEELLLFIRFSGPLKEFALLAKAVKEGIFQKTSIAVDKVIPLEGQIPKTTSGKIRRFILVERYQKGEFDSVLDELTGYEKTPHVILAQRTSKKELLQAIKEEVALLIGERTINDEQPLFEQGLTSSRLVQLHTRLSQKLDPTLSLTAFFDHPSPLALATYLERKGEVLGELLSSGKLRQEDQRIAVIGMACRLPGGATTPSAFWKNLTHNVDSVSEVQSDRWEPAEHFSPHKGEQGKMYTTKGGFLDRIAEFDAQFFGITPVEAEAMDPQHRLLLEVSWEAFEDAAIDPSTLKGSRTGVFIGISQQEYAHAQLHGENRSEITQYALTGASSCTGVGRLSYFYDFRGPNMAIDTACSSSLVALHQAVQSLRLGESTLAVAGGVNLILTPEGHIALSTMGALSPDGRCHTFDQAANGYVRSEGCGLFILKRYTDAVRDGDNIHAIVRGSALSHDGRSNGLTAPNGLAQQEALRKALNDAGIAPEEVQYIEAHGTGTPLGDPIEVQALSEVFASEGRRKEKLFIGSVKAHIGHLESAAGIAGALKVVLALQHEALPGQLHFSTPNPLIPWEQLPLQVVAQETPWKRGEKRRLAGVSSFGFSGTNAHVLFEEAPIEETTEEKELLWHLCPLSAKTEAALRALAEQYILSLGEVENISDLCFSASIGRAHHAHRGAVVAKTTEDLKETLQKFIENKPDARLCFSQGVSSSPQVIFLFSGQGSQYYGMAKGLYASSPVFKEVLEECDAYCTPELGESLIDILLTEKGSEVLLQSTRITQPLLFSFQVALAAHWASWGITPSAVLGHSIGEYAAACIAGVFSRKDGVLLTAARGRVMDSLHTKGGMVAVFADKETVQKVLSSYEGVLSIAAFNTPKNTVISGEVEALEATVGEFKALGYKCTPLKVSQGFHSPLMDGILKDFYNVAQRSTFLPPTVPLLSNLTGAFLEEEKVPDATYWTDHIRKPVRFYESVREAYTKYPGVFLEIGPTSTLAALARQSFSEETVIIIHSLRKGSDEMFEITRAAGELYTQGSALNWKAITGGKRRRKVSLPFYPFQRKRYWISPTHQQGKSFPTSVQVSLPSTSSEKTVMHSLKETKGSPQRLTRLEQEVRSIIAGVSRLDEVDIQPDQNLFEMGLDSLLLVQARQIIIKRYEVEFEMSKFYEELATVRKIAAYLDGTVPLAQIKEESKEIHSPTGENSSPSNQQNAIERIVALQLQTMSELMQKQLSLVSSAPVQENVPSSSKGVSIQQAAPTKEHSLTKEVAAHGPYKKIQTEAKLSYSQKQEAHFNELTKRYTAHTQESKEITARYRSVYANSRNVIGFKPELKELIYPITVARAAGSKIWDLNGREYVDVTMGFGVTLFGHTPSFVSEAVQQELSEGAAVGPMSRHAGVVAEKIAALGKVERVSFFTTGTEAVMAGIRIARMATGRDKIVIFHDSYHGSFDGILASGGLEGETPFSFPIAPGTPQKMVDDVIVLKYGDPASLEVIKRLRHDLAAVIVEPVASRKPTVQPREFLHELREITHSSGTVLFFDEIILGFRIAQGGAQQYFGVEADLVTYGKVVGGGLPIGVLSGKARYMDAVDGGKWEYGDNSIPGKKTAFVAGTFNNHPLSMAAARAVMNHLEKEGPQLQESLNSTTKAFCDRLNNFFEEEAVPIRMNYFGSLFRFDFKAELELLNYHLLEKGVYVWEGKNCFLSTAHTQADIDHIVCAVKESVHELREGGFLPEPPSSPRGTNLTQEKNKAYDLPLSESQKEIWFIAHQGTQENLAYQETVPLRLKGAVDLTALEKALKDLTKRHALLQCVSFSGTTQRIDPLLSLQIEKTEATSSLTEWLKEESNRPFTLHKGPFLRVALLTLSSEDHLLALTAHHLIADGWSLGVLVQELGALYKAGLEKREAMLPPPSSYEEFIAWERKEREERSEKNRVFWHATFSTPTAPLDLPTDRPRTAAKSYTGRRLRFSLQGALRDELKKYCRRTGISPFMVFFSTYSFLLRKLSRQKRFVIGFPVAGHSSMNTPSMVGQCTTLLPMVCDHNESESIASALSSMKRKLLELYEYQSVSLNSLEGGNDTEETSTSLSIPEVRVLFNLDRSVRLDFGPCQASFLSMPLTSVKFDLFLNILECDEEFLVDFDYNSSLFDEETVQEWWFLYGAALETLLRDDQSTIKTLFVTAPERKEKGDARLENSRVRQKLLEELSRHASHHPDKVALSFNQGQRTYEDLETNSTLLAAFLLAAQVNEGTKVGLLVECPLRAVEAVYALMKIGAVAVPLHYERGCSELEAIIGATAPSVILTHGGLEALLPEGHTVGKIVSLDAALRVTDLSSKQLTQVSQHRSHLSSSPLFLEYSSSRRGIQEYAVSYDLFYSQLHALREATGMGVKEKLLCYTSTNSFIFEIFPLLFSSVYEGASCTIRQLFHHHELSLGEKEYTHLLLPYSWWSDELKKESQQFQRPLAARTLLLLGGPVLAEQLSTWHSLPASHLSRLVVLFSPLQSCAGMFVKESTAAESSASCGFFSLGIPLGKLSAPIRDEEGGIALPRTFGTLTLVDRLGGERITPYSARRNRLGEIEVQGTIGRTVTLQGHTFSLDEGEAVLCSSSLVQEGRVQLSSSGHLFAAIVPTSPHCSKELRSWLKKTLPRYQVPEQIIELPALPRSPRGEVDAEMLNHMAEERGLLTVVPEGATATEKAVLTIWREVLSTTTVEITDNFFELGGTSLKAAQIISRLNRAFRKGLSLQDLFNAPTVETLAAQIEKKNSVNQATFSSVPLREYYESSNAQRRLWTLEELQPGLSAYNIPLALEVEGRINEEQFASALATLLHRHESLRTTFVSIDGIPWQKVHEEGLVCFTVQDLSSYPDPRSEALSRAQQEAETPFDVASGPLLRAVLFTLSKNESRTPHALLVLTIHHIISDGWSMKVLVQDLLAIYNGEESTLPNLPIQYKEYAAWQTKALLSPAMEEHQRYWKEKFCTAPLLLYPTDFPRPPVKTYRGNSVKVRVGKETTQLMRELVKHEEGSIFTALLAGIAALLGNHAGQEEFVIGIPIAGRDYEELEGLIGFFVNTVPLRLSIKKESSLRDILSSLKQEVLQAYTHQIYPYDALVETLGKARDPSRNPLFDIVVVMDDRKEAYEILSRYGMKEVDLPVESSQFDLTFYLTEEDDDLLITVVYNTDLFKEATVTAFTALLREVCSYGVRHPSAPLLQCIEPRAPRRIALDHQEALPLTPHQERLWFVDEFERNDLYEGSPVYYNMPLVVRIEGEVDSRLLEESIREVLLRHAVLTYRIEKQGELLQQRRFEKCRVPLTIRMSSSAEIEQEILTVVQAPFLFGEEPLIRATLLQHETLGQQKTQRSYLVLTFHHILIDNWSIQTITQELCLLYEGRASGVLPLLSSHPESFADEVKKTLVLPEGKVQGQLAYWKKELSGISALVLPTDRPRPLVHTFTGGSCSFVVSDEIFSSLQQFAMKENKELSTVLFSVFSTLLGRYAGQKEVVIGVPVRKESCTVVGPLTNLLVIRTFLEHNPPLRVLVKDTEERIAQARLNQDVPFDTVVLAINPTNDMSRTALFDVLFDIEVKECTSFSVAGATFTLEEHALGWGKYDLSVKLTIEEGKLKGRVVYNRDLFDEETISRLTTHFLTLLSSTITQPDSPVLSLSLLSLEEAGKEWQEEDVGYPRGKNIHQLFEEQVLRTPENVALVCGEDSLTYEELNRRANKLAHYLRKEGVTADTRVGVYLDRSIELIVAFLGILKAGGAYVPLDPHYPKERVEFMIEDSGVSIVLTQSELAAHLSLSSNITVVTESRWKNRKGEKNLSPVAAPHHLAYLIYTSGSTGRPKGVMIEHENVVRLMIHDAPLFDFSSQDVWTLFHSPCFDFSVWEMYGALLFGGKLVIVPLLTAQDPSQYRALLAQHQVTVVNQTPTAFYALSREECSQPTADLSVRYIIFGGEALKPSALSEWRTRYPSTKLINMYGITETTVHVTYKEITDKEIAENINTIGAPIPTLQVYVLDEYQHPVPPGVTGELCVGGLGVARGYLNREELTKERFPADPFLPGKRMYRSGDLARYLPSGELLYFGRMDNQVKIRGFRIELGEIENQVLRHSSVQEAVVFAHTGEDGEKALYCYFTAEKTVVLSSLRTHLREVLPDYMIPSFCLQVSRMPRTSNGKVDKKLLLSLSASEERKNDPSVEGTVFEEAISSIWEEVLGSKTYSFTDNFFEVGGHSLKATQVVSRLHKRLGIKITLKEFFTTPTIKELAELATGRSAQRYSTIEQLEKAEHYLVSSAQRRLWTVDQVEGASVAYNSYGAFLLKGALHTPSLQKALALLLHRHESLRTSFISVEGEPRQVIHESVVAQMEVLDLRDKEYEVILEELIQREMTTPFDLSKAPLLRSTLLRIEDDGESDQHIWLITVHHIISDGWSVNLFIRELSELYTALSEGKNPQIAPLRIHYKEYSVWQQNMMKGEEGALHREYWLQKLGGESAPLPLLTDIPRPPTRSGRGEQLYFALSQQLTQKVKRLAQEERCTLFMTLLGAVKALLYQRTSATDITVGSPVAGRDHSDLEDQLGFYVNTLPLRDVFTADSSFSALLALVKRSTTEAFAHQTYPFDQIVEDVGKEREPGRHPLFDVMVILQNNAPLPSHLGKVSLTLLPEKSVSSKFDLNFMFEEKEALEGTLEFATDLFTPESMKKWIDDLLRLLEVVSENPQLSLKEIKKLLVTDEERKKEEAFLQTTREISDQF